MKKILEISLLKCLVAIVLGSVISSPKLELSSINSFLDLEPSSIPVVGEGLTSVITFCNDLRPGIIYYVHSHLAANRDRTVVALAKRYPNSSDVENFLKRRIQQWQSEEQRIKFQSSLQDILSEYPSDSQERLDYLITFLLEILPYNEVQKMLK